MYLAKRNSKVPPPRRTDGRVTTLTTQPSLPGRNGPRDVRVFANAILMTADGGTSTAFTCDQNISETPTTSTVHFAKSASY